MNPTTQDRIRKAVQDALADRDDASAAELLAILTGQHETRPLATQLVLPPARQIVEGPAHDYHYWVRFIREHFIPFMEANGRMRFTSPELLGWLDRRTDLGLTSGDTKEDSKGREVWRNGVTSALASMKRMGILAAPRLGKDYSIRGSRYSGVGRQ